MSETLSTPFTIIIIIITICLIFIFIGTIITVIRRRRRNQQIENRNRSINSNKEISIPNQSKVNVETPNNTNINTPTNFYNNQFSACNGSIIKDDPNTVYFISASILQADPNNINLTSIYFEIEILDFKPDFDLLIGYCSECVDEISVPNILYNYINNIVQINKTEYSKVYIDNIKTGDILGYFYNSLSKQATFIYNGDELSNQHFEHGLHTIFPTVYSTGGTLIKYNFGESDFVYQKANLIKLGYHY